MSLWYRWTRLDFRVNFQSKFWREIQISLTCLYCIASTFAVYNLWDVDIQLTVDVQLILRSNSEVTSDQIYI